MKKGDKNQERDPSSSKLVTSDALPKAPGAYTIVDKDDDVVYAGSSNNLYQRYHEHRHTLKKGNHRNAGLQALSNDSLLRFHGTPTETKDEALNIEQTLINEHMGKPKFCNRSTDARVHATGHVISPETQAKMTASRTGQKRDPAIAQKVIEIKRLLGTDGRGVPQTQEHRDKRSAAMREHYARLRESREGKS